jgi:hypothetical protein
LDEISRQLSTEITVDKVSESVEINGLKKINEQKQIAFRQHFTCKSLERSLKNIPSGWNSTNMSSSLWFESECI